MSTNGFILLSGQDFVLRLYQALESWELQATEQLLKAPSINVDETSFRVDRKNHWIHVYSSGDLTLKFLHRKRGTEAIEAINIIVNARCRAGLQARQFVCLDYGAG